MSLKKNQEMNFCSPDCIYVCSGYPDFAGQHKIWFRPALYCDLG